MCCVVLDTINYPDWSGVDIKEKSRLIWKFSMFSLSTVRRASLFHYCWNDVFWLERKEGNQG